MKKYLFILKKILFKFLSFTLGTLFYICSFIVTLLLQMCTGYTTPIKLILISLIGFAIISLMRNFVWRFFVVRRKLQTKKNIICNLILYFVLCQLFLLYVIPVSSLLPKSLLESAGIARYIEGSTCNIENDINATKSFWGKSIDYSQVHIVEGGMMRNLYYLEKIGIIPKPNNLVRAAEVFGNTIYLAQTQVCESRTTIFHEMTHIWQEQNLRDHLYGVSKIPGFIRSKYDQLFDKDSLYDYGGYEGLKKAKEEGKTFFDFGTEQQAMIVEHLEYFNEGFKFTEAEGGQKLTQAYKDILQFYVRQMLSYK